MTSGTERSTVNAVPAPTSLKPRAGLRLAVRDTSADRAGVALLGIPGGAVR